MKKSRYTDSQILSILKQNETGAPVLELCREGLGVDVDLSLPSARVIRSLEQIIEWRGKPLGIRCELPPVF